MLIVPPGGFAGFAQQTPATQAMFQRGRPVTGTRRRKRRTKAKTKRAAPRARTRKRAKAKRLVKGSRAAKAYMAKIRRKRK